MKTHLITLITTAFFISIQAHAWDANKFKMPSDADLKKNLTGMQYEVTRKEGTEPPFHNAYFDNHEDGIYVDVISGEPLFSSKDKYDSHTGWPSFTKPIEPGVLASQTDADGSREEVKSKVAKSHLGHVFDDGPQPTGLRYCMDSAALRFIPAKDLGKIDPVTMQDYKKYQTLFAKSPAEVKKK